jgi:hypothetical protein
LFSRILLVYRRFNSPAASTPAGRGVAGEIESQFLGNTFIDALEQRHRRAPGFWMVCAKTLAASDTAASEEAAVVAFAFSGFR